MTLEQYFRISAYVMLTASLLMLVATRQLDLVSPGLFGAALVGGWLIDSGRLRWWGPKRWAKWLQFAYLPVLLLEIRYLGVSPVRAVIHFVFFVTAFRLLRVKQNRDWLWLCLVSFLQVMLAAGMTLDTTFLLLLLVYLLAAISTLMSFEIRRAQQAFAAQNAAVAVEYWRERRAVRQRLKPPRWRRLGVFALILLGLILLLATPLFLAMPRFGRGFDNGLLRSAALSGFSEQVRLGEVAQIKLNPQVVMRVRVAFPPGQERIPLRWRGVTLDYFDGRTWSRPEAEKRPVLRTGDSFWVYAAGRARPLTEQRFFLEPLNLRTVFAAPRPVWVSGVQTLRRDSGDGLSSEPHSFHNFRYTVLSDTSRPSELALRADNGRAYSPELRRYLQLPATRDRRLDEMALQLTRGMSSPWEVAHRIEEHLRTAYGYSLDLQPVSDDEDPVAEFLFRTKEGHCEYFATAMTLLLRARGVPARIVNGFQTGEYSEAADVYTVRQADAHSWVEVYFQDHGWVAFDPTPDAGLNDYGDGWLAQLRQYGAAVEMFWQENIVSFGAAEQMAIALTAQRWLASWRNDSESRWFDWKQNLVHWWEARRQNGGTETEAQFSWRNAATHPLLLGLLGLVVLTAAVYGWRRRSNSWRYRSRRDAPGSAIAFYQEMLRTLERAGHKRAVSQTPREFATALSLPGVQEITRLYQQTRFGGRPLEASEIERVGSLLRELKQLSKNQKIS